MSFQPAVRFFLCACLLGLGILSHEARVAAQDTPGLTLGQPVQGNLTASAPTQDWQIDLAAGEAIAVLVNATSGDLDPTVRLSGPDGELVAENDDRVPGLIYHAGLEVTVREAGQYSVQVGRFAGDGDYQLWVLPGYSRVWEYETFTTSIDRWAIGRFTAHQDEQLRLEAEPEFSVYVKAAGGVPVGDMYLQADMSWLSSREDSQATLGLVFRVQDDGTRRPPGYYFLIKPDATWSVLLRDGGEFAVLQDDLPNSMLEADRITLGVQVTGSRFRFYANGVLLGQVADDTFGTGTWGLHIRGATQNAQATVDNLLLTVPTRPLPDFPAEIATWQAEQPEEIATELQRRDVLPDGGERTYFFAGSTYETGPRRVRVFSLPTPQATYANLMVGVDVRPLTGENLGCGLAVRYQDEANQLLAFADTDGGAGLVHIRNGQIAHNTYDLLAEVDEPLSDGRQRLHIIVWDDVAAYYVNGQRLAVAVIPPSTGSLSLALINYATDVATCDFDNLWIWQ